jgi:hypothetical protein
MKQGRLAESRPKWLNAVTFNDHGKESLLALELAERDQSLPWLLCQIEYETEFYRTYDPDKDIYKGEVWYENYLNQLNFHTQIFAHGMQYQLFQVNHREACLSIWQMADSDKGISCAMLSGDSDPQELLDVIDEHYYCQNKFVMTGASQWAYWLNYGGGSDEYYACFETNRKMTFRVFEQLLAQHKIKHIGMKVR